MNLPSLMHLLAYGTSEGVTKAWDTRGRSHHDEYQHGVHIGIFDRPEQPNQFAPSTGKFFSNAPISMAERERVMRAFKDAYLVGKQKVDLRQVVPMQKTITQSRYNRYLDGLRQNPEAVMKKIPAVFNYQGKSYLLDGHHRMAFEVSQGKDKADAMVFALNHTTGVA